MDVFIVDFLCIKAKLIIEVDGKNHNFQKEYDDARTQYFNKFGFKVIRFTNEEVLKNEELVKDEIIKNLNFDSLNLEEGDEKL